MKIWAKFNAGFQLCPPDFNFAPPPPDLAKLATPLPITKVIKRTKSSIFGYIYASDFVTSYTSDVTNGANQSPSLNGFIGTKLISIRKAQRKLCQLSYVRSMTVVKNAALRYL